jgi:deoxyribodipyrimidine photo-lyase
MKEIQQERVRQLNEKDIRDGDYVLYWMQEAQRAEYNYALEYAVQKANEIGQRLLVLFGLTADYPEANLRHYAFMLEGLRDVEADLQRRGIRFVVKLGSPSEVALEYGKHASMIVCDMGYMRPQKGWPTEIEKFSLDMEVEGLDLADIDAILDGMDLDSSVSPVSHLYKGGTSEAKAILDKFIETRFETYVEHRNQPQTDDVSHMSKYLHYGHISPVYVALKIRGSGGPQDDVDSYLEEVIVRRELSMNFCHYTPDYDSYSNLPGWAKETLEEHKEDEREYVYSREQLENAETHDQYWNAAMKEMIHTGYMHNHMRMYWGKKILEWTETPQEAYATTLYLNNKYFLDGRDPNSFANVAWVFGQHDRGWKERDVYGKVRYMSSGGLERKAKPEQYVQKVERLIEEDRAEGPV